MALLLLPPVYVFAGCTIGFILAKTACARARGFGATIAAVGFANSTGMPRVLLAVAEKNVTPGHGSIGCLSMYLLIYPLLQWLIADGGSSRCRRGDKRSASRWRWR